MQNGARLAEKLEPRNWNHKPLLGARIHSRRGQGLHEFSKQTPSNDRSVGLGRTRLFHPWAHEPEGGQAPMFPCCTFTVRGRGLRVRLGPVGSQVGMSGPVWSRMGPYISPTLLRDRRVIRRGSLGPVSVGTLFWHDGTRQGSTDRSTVPYRRTIDVRTPWARHGVPTGPPGPRWDPTDPRRTPGGTVGPRLIGASPVWAARSSYWLQPVYLLLSHPA